MNLETIKSLIKGRLYEEALDACKQLSESSPKLKYEVMRQKSFIHTHRAEYKAAVKELSLMIEEGQAELRDYHSAAFWALHDEQFEKAREWFLITLRIGEEQNDEYFESDSLFLLAYIYMELGEYENAMSFLNKLEPEERDDSYLTPNKGFCELSDLRNEIERRGAEIESHHK